MDRLVDLNSDSAQFPRGHPTKASRWHCLLPPSVPTPAPASCAQLTARLNSCRGIGHKAGLQPYEHLRQRTYDGGHATTGRRSALLRPSALCFPHFETYLLVRLLVSAMGRRPRPVDCAERHYYAQNGSIGRPMRLFQPKWQKWVGDLRPVLPVHPLVLVSCFAAKVVGYTNTTSITQKRAVADDPRDLGDSIWHHGIHCPRPTANRWVYYPTVLRPDKDALSIGGT